MIGLRAIILFFCLLAATSRAAQGVPSEFEQANKFYEQGKYADAAAAYEKLIAAGKATTAVRFNLGNAYFKLGNKGKAIKAYRSAMKFRPRDPELRFNLDFVREQVAGAGRLPSPGWQQFIRRLTVNEWTVLAAVAFWVWFVLLCLREMKPGLRKTLSGYTATSGICALLMAGLLAAAYYAWNHSNEAVVTAPTAVVRFGPLEESNVSFQLNDGSEVVIVGRKESQGAPAWFQVRDGAGRVGWLKRDQVAPL